MNSTALGAEKENINFISEAHEKFYYEKIQKVREADVYHKALCYCIGMNEDTRRNVDRIYNFKTGCVKPECLHEGWQTNPKLEIEGILLTMVDNRTNYAKDISALVVENYGSKVRIFENSIPMSVRAAEISDEGVSIYEHDPNGKVASAYQSLTEEVLADE